MKRKVFTLTAALAASVFLLHGCKGKENDGPATVVGSWELGRFTYNYTVNVVPPSVFSIDTTYPSGKTMTYTFNADNSYVGTDNTKTPAVTTNGSYQLLSGNKIVVKAAASNSDTVDYSLSGNKMTLSKTTTGEDMGYPYTLSYVYYLNRK